VKSLRIKFEKAGLAKYISHLDLNRVFARSLARAKTEIAHSEGFNPRPKIVFASAIPLGIESLCEFADIKITDAQCAPAQIFEKIKNIFPEGINILEVYEPENNFKNIDRTRFHIFVKTDAQCAPLLDKFLNGDVIVEKKPGVNINLKDYIIDSDILSEESGYKIINAVVKTNQEMYLNPENIIKGLKLNNKIGAEDHFIKKICVYDKDNKIFI